MRADGRKWCWRGYVVVAALFWALASDGIRSRERHCGRGARD